ncbi:MAG: hypothetical protein SNJ79_01330 [Sphingomonadaceae bacterium]
MTRWLIYSEETGEAIRFDDADVPELAGGEAAAAVPMSALADPPLTEWSPAARAFVDSLAYWRARLLADIDDAADRIAQQIAPSNQWTAEVRREKRAELARWDAEGEERDVTAEAFPFFVAEAQAFSVDPATIAEGVRAATAVWLAAGPQLEAARVGGRAAVRAAQTPIEMQTAAASAQAAMQQIADQLADLLGD